MCYPTTLALIAALWNGPARTKAIALWSAIGAAFASLGPLLSGTLLEHFWWGSVFLVTVPVAIAAFAMAWFLVPAHVNETTEQVDNVGGILSVVLVGALILAINFAVVPNAAALVVGLAIIVVAALIAFVIRQRRAANPLYDLHVAARPTFWVAAVAGIVVFGSLMGAMFIGQQFLQNVLGYSSVEAGAAILPAAFMMVLVAPRSAKLVGSLGARMTLLIGYVFVFLGFLAMLLLWKEGIDVLESRTRLRAPGYRRRVRADASCPLTDQLRATYARRHGIGYRRPPTRPRGRLDAVDLRRLAHRGIRDRDDRRALGHAQRIASDRQHREPTHEVVLQRRGPRPAIPEVREPDHRSRQILVPPRRPMGIHRRHRRRATRGRDRVLLVPEEANAKTNSSMRTRPRTMPHPSISSTD